jgi:transposase
LRQEHSTAILARIERIVHDHLHRVMPGSLLGKALHYLSA